MGNRCVGCTREKAMNRQTGINLMQRALTIVEDQMPEMAESYMQVPLDYYKSAELAAKEWALCETTPLALIAASEIAKPHDYLVRGALGRSLLFTRDENGEAHVFLNYCRHRGAEPAQGAGNARRFSCPYHAWTYDTKGCLVGMPLRDRHKTLDLTKFSLVELPSEERHGFIWVVLTPGHAIDVAAHLGAFDGEIAALGCDRMKYYSAIPETRLGANWKAVSEGLLESVHAPHVHPGTFGTNPQAMGVDLATYDLIGGHIRYTLPMFTREDAAKLRATPEAEWQPEKNLGSVWVLSPAILIAHDQYGLLYCDLLPGPTTSESVMRYGWLSPVEEAPPGQLSPQEMARRAAQAIVDEDRPVWEGCGRGLTRGAHDYALIGRNEKGVQLFHRHLAERIGYAGLRYC
jgi:phenylpropionate dioxygenase-like ring-hydroxylating dioxygenase large terminal subunit